jgi:diguanylate cyclase (GGDEF)-like protein
MLTSPRSGTEPVGVNQAGSPRPVNFLDEPSLLRAELEGTWRELGAANRQIARLLHDRKRNRRMISRLKAMATTDVVTSLVNRRRFDEVLEANFAQSIIRDSPLSVLMVDVDCFKSYNDTFGHPAGDFVLSMVARHLVKSVRSIDVVARYGGDEFAILLSEADAVVALNCAERYRETMESFCWPLRPVTASFGVATRTSTIGDPATLVEAADRALYHSKRGGRTWVSHMGNLDPSETSTHMTPKTWSGRTRTPHQDDRESPWEGESFKHPKHSEGDLDRVEDNYQIAPERGAGGRE